MNYKKNSNNFISINKLLEMPYSLHHKMQRNVSINAECLHVMAQKCQKKMYLVLDTYSHAHSHSHTRKRNPRYFFHKQQQEKRPLLSISKRWRKGKEWSFWLSTTVPSVPKCNWKTMTFQGYWSYIIYIYRQRKHEKLAAAFEIQ